MKAIQQVETQDRNAGVLVATDTGQKYSSFSSYGHRTEMKQFQQLQTQDRNEAALVATDNRTEMKEIQQLRTTGQK